jgi:UDP-N-acetylmuramoyl-L-alanyl-D-glutamate--2,6-diaminopimelate ligase
MSQLDNTLRKVKKFIPKALFKAGQPIYHRALSLVGSVLYRFPSKGMHVIVITGTKGKTSTTEIVNAILEEVGYSTAVLGTLRFKIGKESTSNKYKMSVPGRFFVQSFLRKAANAGCQFAVIEMTSEGAKQFRHKGIEFNTMIFTNLSPEHIESHGSFKKYKEAKISIAKELAWSSKRPRTIIANNDDPHGDSFLAIHADVKLPYSLMDIEIVKETEQESVFVYEDKKITIHLPGRFNLYNCLAGLTLARALSIDTEVAKQALEKLSQIRGRLERVEEGQDFSVIVDYAHTADSLEKVYNVYRGARKIAVLGGTGGGRDTEKRKIMGAIAEEHCETIILTNEDPYDEDPMKIIQDVASGITHKTPLIILDRREAIARAIQLAKKGDVILITGKGTDPFIMEADGKRTPWDDADVAREELRAHMKTTQPSIT